ncbi:hypothetical protein PO124_06285 [Bacillus licheniformis]|nr:hypothetical protein [Bacillus licheniformis]
MNIPVYGGQLAIGLLRKKLEEHGLLRQTKLHIIEEDDIVKFRKRRFLFQDDPQHSGLIRDCRKTPQGNIVHTGDFKFDLHRWANPPT